MIVKPDTYIDLRDSNGEIIRYKILDVTEHTDGWIYFSAISEHADIQHFRVKPNDKAVQEIIH